MTDPQRTIPRATFSHMEHGTREDWAAISTEFMPFVRASPDRVLAHLRLPDGDCGDFPIDRLAHSLQTATLAHRDGRGEKYVVCALLHDISDTLDSFNHPDIVVAILKSFVSPENLWVVEKYGIFQGYYFFHHLGLDRNLREQYCSQPELFERTAEFCVKYDVVASISDYDNLPLSFFEPIVRRVLTKLRSSICVKKDEGEPSQPKAAAA